MGTVELELVRGFVNTLDVETGEDAIATPAALTAWLAEHGLCAASVRATTSDVERAARAPRGASKRTCSRTTACRCRTTPWPSSTCGARRSRVQLGFVTAVPGSGPRRGVSTAQWERCWWRSRRRWLRAAGRGSRSAARRLPLGVRRHLPQQLASLRAMGVCGNRQKAHLSRATRRTVGERLPRGEIVLATTHATRRDERCR